MDLKNQFLFFFSTLGVFNGFLVSLYILLFLPKKRIANYFLGALILMLSIRIGKSVLVTFGNNVPRIYLQIGLSTCFFIGPILYYYLKSVLHNISVIPKSWKIQLGSIAGILLLIGLLYSYQAYPDYWKHYFVKGIYVQWVFFILLSGWELRSIIRKLVSKEQLSITELWLLAIYVGNALICACYIFGYFRLYIIGPLSFSFVFYALLFFLLFKKNRNLVFEEQQQKYASKKIEATTALSLKEQLYQLMEEKELYKDSSIKLKDVAQELKITPHQLSQLLNDNIGKSFASYMNELRVETAKKLILEFDQITLEAIGFDAGFSSKSTFYATFKKLTGQTPLQYKKQQLEG